MFQGVVQRIEMFISCMHMISSFPFIHSFLPFISFSFSLFCPYFSLPLFLSAPSLTPSVLPPSSVRYFPSVARLPLGEAAHIYFSFWPAQFLSRLAFLTLWQERRRGLSSPSLQPPQPEPHTAASLIIILRSFFRFLHNLCYPALVSEAHVLSRLLILYKLNHHAHAHTHTHTHTHHAKNFCIRMILWNYTNPWILVKLHV